MIKTVVIHSPTSTIILDEVSFCLPFHAVTIEGGHPSGPVFACGAARAVLTITDADRLVAAGAIDKR